MITFDLESLIWHNFEHEPTFEQRNVIKKWCEFLLSREDNGVFVLCGYAGTGKTSLLGAIVRTMHDLKQSVRLLAPTGRAAKVFSLYADSPAYTIHRKIYRQKSFAEDCFQPNVNLQKNTLFIVDEASMIANDGLSGSIFGTGRLLDDLIHYVYSGDGCRLMLVGDTAQLPPVSEENSPALDVQALEGYDLNVYHSMMTQVVRQVEDSGILWNATILRRVLMEDDFFDFPRIKVDGVPDVEVVSGNELIEALESSYFHSGVDQTVVVTRSNKRAGIFNAGIRGRILGYEEELSSGDQIMVVKNNYFWVKEPSDRMPFIANGDCAVVHRLRNERSLYGFRFVDVSLSFPDYDDFELEATVLIDTLKSDAPALTREQQEILFQSVWEDYPEFGNKRDRMKHVKEDRHFNALQIKYSYAVTCHKAQGGQWERVFLDQGYVTREMLSPDYVRWLYTAITRATQKVYLINWPDAQVY